MLVDERAVAVNGIGDTGEVVAGGKEDRLRGVFFVRLNQGGFHGTIGKEPAAAGHELIQLAHDDFFPNELPELFLAVIAGCQKTTPLILGKKVVVGCLGEPTAGLGEHILNAGHCRVKAHHDTQIARFLQAQHPQLCLIIEPGIIIQIAEPLLSLKIIAQEIVGLPLIGERGSIEAGRQHASKALGEV